MSLCRPAEQFGVGCSSEHRILEERSRTAVLWVAGTDHHALAGAYGSDSGPRFRQGRGAIAACEIFLQIGIPKPGFAVRFECKGRAQDDVASALAGVEDACAIAEA